MQQQDQNHDFQNPQRVASSSPDMQEDNISIPDYDSTVLSPEVTDALNNINPEQRAIIIHYIHQTQLKQSFTGHYLILIYCRDTKMYRMGLLNVFSKWPKNNRLIE
ncbi:MAG: hypothetical protein K2N96_02255 [Muribaculaceae bacterium]|nr:hypothetical protein [Muribaculaceae bacterium]